MRKTSSRVQNKNLKHFQSEDGRKVGKRVFSVRLPERYEKKLEELGDKRSLFIREVIINEFDRLDQIREDW